MGAANVRILQVPADLLRFAISHGTGFARSSSQGNRRDDPKKNETTGERQ